jgi:O-antigen/teichoic acid export membrane protein
VLRAFLNVFFLGVVLGFLTPNDMASYAALMTFYIFLAPFLDAGMTNVLLKFDRADLSRDLQMFAVCLGSVLGLAFLFIVPVLAGTLGIEITAWSVRILAFAVFLSAIQGQLRACITKRKGFQELAVVDTIAVVGAISTCTYLLFAGYKEEVLVLKLFFLGKNSHRD